MHWWFVWTVALLSLRSPSALGASNFHLRNHTGALFLYAFDNGQVPTSPPSFVPDRLGLNLMGNLTTSTTGAVAWSADRQGILVPSRFGGVRGESDLTSSELLASLSSEVSIELFFANPENPLSQNLLIAGFGNWPPGSPYAECDASNPGSHGGWRLSLRVGTNLEFEAIVLRDGVPTCWSLTLSITANALRHFVFRVKSGVFSLISHSGSATTILNDISFSGATWLRSPAPLTLASPHATTGWIGGIYMIAMYDRFLSTDEIQDNYAFGPPNSLPTCAASALAVLEDGTSTLFP